MSALESSQGTSKKSPKLILFSVVFIDLLGFGIMIPMLPFFVRHFGKDAFYVGLLMFVYSAMQMIVAPFWGKLSDRIGRRPVLLLTICGQFLAFLWAGFSVGYYSLLLSRVFAGIFSANISTANAFMADITTEKDRAKGMGMIGAAFGLGFIFGPAIGGLLIPYGYAWPFFASAALAGINLVWAYFSLPEPLGDLKERSAKRRRVKLSLVPHILATPQLATPIVLFFLTTLAFTQLEVTFGLFVTDRFFLSERSSGLLLAAMGLVMALVQGGLIGRVVKRLGELGTIRIGLPLIAFGLLGVAIAPDLRIFLVGLFVLSVGYSLNNPCLSSWTSKAAPAEEQGAVLGIYQSGSSLARILGPILGGFLYTRMKTGAFLSALVVVLVAKIIFSIYLRWQMASKANLAAAEDPSSSASGR